MLRYRIFITLFLLVTTVCAGACGPQGRRTSDSRNSKRRIPQPAPIFHPRTPGPSPAILLLPPARYEISDENAIARDLAAQGYVAQVVDYGDLQPARLFRDAVGMDNLKRLVSESLAALRSQSGVDPNRIGVIGYSFGGFFATWLASRPESAGVKAGVIYYGIYKVPDLIKDLRTPVLVFQGETDAMREFVSNALEMKLIAIDHKKHFDLVFYPNARHGFDRRPRSRHGGAIAADSWARTIAFMNEHVKQARL